MTPVDPKLVDQNVMGIQGVPCPKKNSRPYDRGFLRDKAGVLITSKKILQNR